MTGPEYHTARTTLGLSNAEMAEWLGVGKSSVHRWEQTGVPAGAAKAIEMAVGLKGLTRLDVEESGPSGRGWLDEVFRADGEFVAWKDIEPLIPVKGGKK